MKIVMAIEFHNEDLEYQDNLLAKMYTKRGYEVTIITSTIGSVFDYYADKDRGAQSKAVYQTPNAKVIRLPFKINLLNRFKMFPDIRPILDEEQPDLIFFHDPMPNIAQAAAWVKTHPRSRLIMDYHADYSNSAKNWISKHVLHGIMRKYFLDRALPQVHQILSVWPAGFHLLHEVYGIPYEQMGLMPLGADLERAKAVRERGEGAALRKELGIGPDDLVVFTGGKLDKPKKTEELLKAVRELDDPRIHVLVIGKPETGHEDYLDLLKQIAAGSNRVHFRGWLDRDGVYRHMDAADIAIFPASQSVLWTQVIGSGLPLVVAEHSELERGRQEMGFLNRHDNAVILDDARPFAPQIRDILAGLVADREQLQRMKDGARRTADEILDYEKLVDLSLKGVPAFEEQRQALVAA